MHVALRTCIYIGECASMYVMSLSICTIFFKKIKSLCWQSNDVYMGGFEKHQQPCATTNSNL
jgi:hypothetical protein